ncbi:MAG: VOC family protein [Dehalococcoidia bacterium]|nr:VOC family protein [Chloroflexota bacterium]
MVKFNGINHLAMVTGDMDKTVRFYRDVLGMPLVATTGNVPDRYPYRHYFFELGDGNTIAFFEWPGMIEEFHKPAGLPAKGRVQFDHISFNVEDEEALLALRASLESKSVEVTEVVDHKIIHSIYFTDPNGIALEASYWIKDPTGKEPDYSDAAFFTDPDPVPSARPPVKVS